MAKRKYYVVWRGKETGIFNTWAECELNTKGFEGARFKAYEDEQEAKDAFAAGPPAFHKATSDKSLPSIAGVPITDSISVDAACSGNPGAMEYQGVYTATKERLFHVGPFPEGTVNIGEFLAIVHGLGYLKQRGLTIPIYSDSVTAIKWVKNKKANTKLAPNAINDELFNLIQRAERWLLVNEYTNPIIKWNTAAWGEIYADFGRK